MNRKTLIAAVVFAALLVGAVLSMTRKPERGISRLSLTALEKAKVDGFELSGPQAVKIAKKDGVWKMENGRAADGAAVDRALDMLTKIDSSEVVAAKVDKWADYDVTDEKGTRVRLTAAGKPMADVVLGKSNKGASYVRHGDEVFEVARFQPAFFTRPANTWQQLKLFTDTAEDVGRVEVALQGQTPFALVKADGKWKLEDAKAVPAGFRFDEAAARTFVNGLVNASARQILDSDPGVETTGLTDAADRVAFVGKDGARRVLRLGSANADKQVYAKLEGAAEVVTLPEYTAKAARKTATDLRELTVIQLDTPKVTGWVLKSGKALLALEKKGSEWKVAKSSEPVPAGFALDPQKVEQRLTALAGARALRVATAEEVGGAGLAKPSATVTATLEGGTSVTLAFGAETKSDNMDAVFGKGNIDGDVYLIGKWVRDQLTGGLTTLKK